MAEEIKKNTRKKKEEKVLDEKIEKLNSEEGATQKKETGEEKKVEEKKEEKVLDEKTENLNSEESATQKKETGEEKKVEKKKKEIAKVNVKNLPISTKVAGSICRFIKNKKIDLAINDLKEVMMKKKAVPMKGEIPHRRLIMSGRYPVSASKYFIKALESLKANSLDLEEPVISLAVANIGQRLTGRTGIKRKRTHVLLIAKERKEKRKWKKRK